MTQEKEAQKKCIHFRQITERFCSQIGDNVIVMQTIDGESEYLKCMSAYNCPHSEKCKNNL